MKLLYLWVYDWKMFNCQEFNFSDEYCFNFNIENNCLKCDRNDKHPSKLYYSENVELISYIIGDNGSGKTTLMEILLQVLPYDGGISFINDGDYFKVIYALKEDVSSDVYIYTTLDSIKLEIQGDIKIRNCKNSIVSRMEGNSRNFFSCQEMKTTAVIFHSNILDRNRYNAQEIYYGVKDISLNGLLMKDFEYRTTDLKSNAKTELRVSLDADMIRQIEFISENSDKGYEEWIPFSLPQRLNIYFKEEHRILNSIYQYDNSKFHIDNESKIYKYDEYFDFVVNDLNSLRKILAHIYKDIMKKYNKLYQDTSNTFRNLIYKGILMSYLRLIFPETVGMGATEQFRKLISCLRKFMGGIHFNKSNKFVEKLIEVVDISSDELRNAIVKINEFLIDKEQHGIKNQLNTFYFLTDSNEKTITNFYKIFRATAVGADYLTFQWNGLSSGEYNLLNMYSRLYSLCKKMISYDAIILMIDEADLSYHPKWQQMYMKSLVKFLNKFYSKQRIQIIVATHSPIMLSDALKGNVIFLGNALGGDLDNTFGANIYDLYREGMFLERDKYGVIGTYASEKIENIMERLNSWEKGQVLEDMFEIKNFISYIGEPIIKRIMQDKFEVIEQDAKGNNQNNEEISMLIEKLNKLYPEELDKVMEGIHKK